MLIKCPKGQYDTVKKEFYFPPSFIPNVGYDDYARLTPQDLADCLSIYHKEKVKEDHEYKKKHI